MVHAVELVQALEFRRRARRGADGGRVIRRSDGVRDISRDAGGLVPELITVLLSLRGCCNRHLGMGGHLTD